MESALLFRPQQTQYPNPAVGLKKLQKYQKVHVIWLGHHRESRLPAWYTPAQLGKPTILFAHGNAGNRADNWAVSRPFVAKGYGFVSFDYRGYGEIHGKPSQKGMIEDFIHASTVLEEQYHIPLSHQVAMGASLGGGVVLHAAEIRDFRAVVVYSTFTRLGEVAANQGPVWLKPLATQLFGLILRNPFNNFQVIQHYPGPIFIAHGQNDTLTPPDMAQILYEKVSHPCKQLWIDPNSAHGVHLTQLAQRLETLLACNR